MDHRLDCSRTMRRIACRVIEPVSRIVHAHECVMLWAGFLGAATSCTRQNIITLGIVDVLRIGDVAVRAATLMFRISLLLLNSSSHCLLYLGEGLRFGLLDLVFELFGLGQVSLRGYLVGLVMGTATFRRLFAIKHFLSAYGSRLVLPCSLWYIQLDRVQNLIILLAQSFFIVQFGWKSVLRYGQWINFHDNFRNFLSELRLSYLFRQHRNHITRFLSFSKILTHCFFIYRRLDRDQPLFQIFLRISGPLIQLLIIIFTMGILAISCIDAVDWIFLVNFKYSLRQV